MPPSSRRLVVVADVGGASFHVGDEAMLAANVAELRARAPAVEITVVGRALASARLADALAALDGAEALFVSGGGNLSSSWPELLDQRIALIGEAARRGLPVVTGGQTIGPNLNASERAALAAALGGVRHLGAREVPSAALALRLGVPPERLVYQPDDAFFLAARAPERAPQLPGAPYLAVTLDPSFAQPGAAEGLRSLAAQLAAAAAESGLRLVFVPHAGEAGQLGDEDGRAGTALRERLVAGGADCVLLPVHPAEATAWITRNAAAVVSSRYHALVFATAGAVPCLGLHRDGYTRIKLEGALAHVLGDDLLEDGCLDAARAEDGALLPAFRRLWERRAHVRAAMAARRDDLAAGHERRWQRLLGRLGWTPDAGDESQGEMLGAPAEHLAAAALAALARAADAPAGETRAAPPMVARPVRPTARAAGGDERLTDAQWSDYTRQGYLRLGRVMTDDALAALRQRADDIALGKVRNPALQMQLDTGGAYDELPAAAPNFEQGTRLYRKIQGLETDDLFAGLLRHPLFLEAGARAYGAHASLSLFRAMVMNKPAGQGTTLPWHQDGGDVWALDRDPLVTVWVALDAATRASGCLEVVPGTHRLGLLTSFGSTLAEEDVARHCPPERVEALEVEAGHALVLHNWLIHRSGVNPTAQPRRAFTACYMDARTLGTLTGRPFPVIDGAADAEAAPFLRHLSEENLHLRASLEEARRYVRSLEEEAARLRAMREEAERYALSLEAERRRGPS